MPSPLQLRGLVSPTSRPITLQEGRRVADSSLFQPLRAHLRTSKAMRTRLAVLLCSLGRAQDASGWEPVVNMPQRDTEEYFGLIRTDYKRLGPLKQLPRAREKLFRKPFCVRFRLQNDYVTWWRNSMPF